LKKADCFSPQRPSKPSHGKAFRSSAGAVGTVATTGRICREGPVVSSHPSPSAALSASKLSWIISQSPSWVLFQSLKT
jgi:hypothetical protein